VLKHANRRGHYVNLTRNNARKQFFWPLVKFLESSPKEGGLGWVRDQDFFVNVTDMIVSTAWGSTVQAFSCPTMSDVAKVRGDRTDWFFVDECQSPNNDVIEALVETSRPMRNDTGGVLELSGTPPQVEPCYFSDACDSEGWAKFGGHQFEHDFPRSREEKWAFTKEAFIKSGTPFEVKETVDANGRLVLELDEDATHPSITREDFGRRRRDPTKTAYRYVKGRNDYDPETVDFRKGYWRHSWGLDLGWEDSDAIVVIATRPDDPERRKYVRWAWSANHVDVFALADLVKVARKVMRPNTAAGDTGGHGAVKVLKTLEPVLGLAIGGKPSDVMTSVRLINDEYEGARLLFPTNQDSVLAELRLAARLLFPSPADSERLARVLALLEHVPDLGAEVAAVSKTVNPRTRKFEINRKGKHGNASEACRYADHGHRTAPAQPQTTEKKPTAADELADYERDKERARQAAAEKAKRGANNGW
jgi:hypothetical protein